MAIRSLETDYLVVGAGARLKANVLPGLQNLMQLLAGAAGKTVPF